MFLSRQEIYIYLKNLILFARRVWRYQRGNQNPYIEEEQTTQWPKEKVQKDKQGSTKHTYKTKHRVTRTPLKTGDELRCSGSSFCSTSGTRRVNLVTNPVISREWGKDREFLYIYKSKTCYNGTGFWALLELYCFIAGLLWRQLWNWKRLLFPSYLWKWS
jgi:hypothetical protein